MILINVLMFSLLVSTTSLFPQSFKDFEKSGKAGKYYIDIYGNRYYLWNGFLPSPLIPSDMMQPDHYERYGLNFSKISTFGEMKYSNNLYIGVHPGAGFKIMEDEKGIIYVVNYTYEGYGSAYSYGYDSLGNLMWKIKGGMPIYTEPAGIFQKDNGTRLSFGYHMGDFELFHFDVSGRKDKTILKNRDFSPLHKLSLPYDSRNWRVARIGEDVFLVVTFKSSVDRDELFNMKTVGDSIHIISFLVNREGEILGSVNLDNAEGKAAILEVDRNAIGTEYYFRNSVEHFRMPDSSLFFVYAPFPRREKGDFVEHFLLYITKFTKDGKLVSFTHKPKVLPLRSLPSGYRIKGFSFRMEYWDYAVDSLGNFYVEIRKYSRKGK